MKYVCNVAVTMRRMMDDEMPLPLCLDWTAQGLSHHKFILQENDAGEIHVRKLFEH